MTSRADEIVTLPAPRLCALAARGRDLARLTATARPAVEQAATLGAGADRGADGSEGERGGAVGGVDGHALTVGAEGSGWQS